MSTRDPVVMERWALAVLRLSLGVFLLVWGLEKFAIPSATVGIWAKFYGVGLAASLVPLVGVLESALALTPEQLANDSHWLYVMGRLRPGVTIEQADANVAAVAASMQQRTPSPVPDDELRS